MSFEYLSDKRANFIFAGLAIPDVSGIYPAVVKLLFSGWFVESSDVGREFRRSEVPAIMEVSAPRSDIDLVTVGVVRAY